MFITAQPVMTAAAAVWTGIIFGERALGGGEPSSTTSALPVSSSSNSPYFSVETQTSSPSVDSEGNSGSGVTKTVLEWVFAIAALLVIAALTVWRYAQLRRNHRPLHTFIPRGHSHEHRSAFSEAPRSVPRTTGLPRLASDSSGDNLTIPMPITMSAALFYPPSLSHGRYPVIVATQDRGRNRRAAQGADIDAQGRRLGPRDPDDHEGDDDKDELPAYDNVNGPPKYMDLQVQMIGAIPLGALPMQVEQPHSRRSGDSPGSTSEGHSSQTSNSSEQVESSISSSDSRTATAENPTSVPSELPPPFLASSASQSSPELNADQTNFPQNIMPC